MEHNIFMRFRIIFSLHWHNVILESPNFMVNKFEYPLLDPEAHEEKVDIEKLFGKYYELYVY